MSDLVFRGDEAAASNVTVAGDTPVVMILLDEFSGVALMDGRHRIDRARLPSFARLADDATWYRNATSVADFTDRAVPAILTGERPGARHRPDGVRPPGEPLHLPRALLRLRRQRARDGHLPPSPVP